VEFHLDPSAGAARNMERDLELLRRGEPAVRLYGWRPAAVTLGRGQAEDVVDVAAARAMGLDLVRRPTGGGALLHDEHEVTYAVVLPHGFPGLPADLAGSYAFVTAPLVACLRTLGVDARIERGHGARGTEGSSRMGSPKGSPDDADDLCYLRREGVHVTARGRKISGGAQRRTSAALLQHGTVLVRRDADRMARLFGVTPDRVRATTTSLEDEGVRVARELLERTLLEEYRRAWVRLELVA
jgi:lipoate-protein ligase A